MAEVVPTELAADVETIGTVTVEFTWNCTVFDAVGEVTCADQVAV
jgi:hypothetical protein